MTLSVRVKDAQGIVHYCSYQQAGRLLSAGVARIESLYPYTLSLNADFDRDPQLELIPTPKPKQSAARQTQNTRVSASEAVLEVA